MTRGRGHTGVKLSRQDKATRSPNVKQNETCLEHIVRSMSCVRLASTATVQTVFLSVNPIRVFTITTINIKLYNCTYNKTKRIYIITYLSLF